MENIIERTTVDAMRAFTVRAIVRGLDPFTPEQRQRMFEAAVWQLRGEKRETMQ